MGVCEIHKIRSHISVQIAATVLISALGALQNGTSNRLSSRAPPFPRSDTTPEFARSTDRVRCVAEKKPRASCPPAIFDETAGFVQNVAHENRRRSFRWRTSQGICNVHQTHPSGVCKKNQTNGTDRRHTFPCPASDIRRRSVLGSSNTAFIRSARYANTRRKTAHSAIRTSGSGTHEGHGRKLSRGLECTASSNTVVVKTDDGDGITTNLTIFLTFF